jgi:cysteine desulfurase/selenocysteine lyase
LSDLEDAQPHSTADALAALRAQFPALATLPAYFNSAYTSLVPTPVLDAARDAAIGRWKRAPEDLERVRERVAAFLHAEARDITFIPGTTQGLALVASRLKLSSYARVVGTTADHRALREPWGRSRLELNRLDANGCVRWAELEARLPGAQVLALAHASNVTGEVAPVAAIAAMARREGAIVVLDAAQTAPHLPLDVDALGVDALVFSGHKAWGLGGVGVLWTRPALAERLGLDATPIEDPLPYEALMALGPALDALAGSRTPALDAHRRTLTAALDAGLRALPGAVVLGPADTADRLPLFSIASGGRGLGAIAEALRRQGVVTRAGMHLAEPLHAALGLDGTLPVSAHTYHSLEDAERLITAIGEHFRA